MKYFVLCILLLVCATSYARKHKTVRGLPRTEVGLMNNVLGSLSNKDTIGYYNLFVPFDTLWHLVMHNPNHSPEATVQLNRLKEHPRALLSYDPAYNPDIMRRFAQVLQKGEDSGLHWKEIVMQRYELYKDGSASRSLTGYDIIAPERFNGLMFIRDLLGRLTFCISISEIQKIDGYFFGGQVLNILEANTADQFRLKEEAEKEYFAWQAEQIKKEQAHADSVSQGLIDSTAKDTMALAPTAKNVLAIDEIKDEDSLKVRREVIDRKYYEGKFDDEIPVKMYVRYMKDLRNKTVTAFDGLYKFGDQVQYSRLNITRNKEGVWVMDDDPAVGTMELELQNKIYTGSWTNNENQTGYDVTLTQKDIPTYKLELLDKMLESGKLGRVDDETKEPTKEPTKQGIGKKDKPESDDDKPTSKKVKKPKKQDPDDVDDDRKPKKKAKKKVKDYNED